MTASQLLQVMRKSLTSVEVLECQWGEIYDKNWPTGWVWVGLSFSPFFQRIMPWFFLQDLSNRRSLMYNLGCWKINPLLLRLLQLPTISQCGGFRSWVLAKLPWGPEAGWQKGFLISANRNSSLHSLSHESSGMTGSWLSPKALVKTLLSPQNYVDSKKLCLHGP